MGEARDSNIAAPLNWFSASDEGERLPKRVKPVI